MPTATAPPASAVRIHVTLPEKIFSKYEKEAQALGFPVEDYVAYRLVVHQDHVDDQALYVNHDNRKELGRLLARNLKGQDDLIAAVKKLATVVVEGVEVALSPELMERLRTRCFNESFDEHIRRVVVQGIETHVGLR